MRDRAEEQWQTRQVREWLLAVLRVALTYDETDKASVLRMAEGLDETGSAASAFAFFRRTSIELCAAIGDTKDPTSIAVFRRHLERIDDPRIKRAFSTAVEFAQPPRPTLHASAADQHARRDLWRGLRR